jgi:hypothetical protein
LHQATRLRALQVKFKTDEVGLAKRYKVNVIKSTGTNEYGLIPAALDELIRD